MILSAVKTMQGSMKAIMQRLEGKAKEKVLTSFGKSVIDAIHMLEEFYSDKVSNPDNLPSEFLEYGTVKSAEQLQQEKQKEAEEKFSEELDAYEEMRVDALIKFANWFWLTGKYEPVKIPNTYSGVLLLYDPVLNKIIKRK
ncbi:hypothetical protein CDIFMA2_05670 [Clostridioides difficile]|nr:hypothetical protein CDIFMA2_05670 [Clostridioides difficile]